MKFKYAWANAPSWVFCPKVGTLLDESHVRRAMRAVLKKAKLPLHFSPHSFRHTYAEAGKSKLLKNLVGRVGVEPTAR